jgi:hypothetical protein
MKKLLKKLTGEQQEYYNFLAHECLLGFSNAEDNFNLHKFPTTSAWLFHSAEFFWKALTILSGKYFELTHEASQKDIMQISGDLLSAADKAKAAGILTRFPEIRRDLARYGYYEKGKVTQTPASVFTKTDTEKDLKDVEWLVNKLREIHYPQVFDLPIKVAVLSGRVTDDASEIPCPYYPSAKFRTSQDWVKDLNDVKDQNGAKVFEASLVSVSELSSGVFPLAINPFGEAYPENGNTEGAGIKMIVQYIRDGGIFVNSAGNPFHYIWDVTAGKSKPTITPILTFPTFNLVGSEDVPVLQLKGTNALPPEAQISWRVFGLAMGWDVAGGVQGPQEVDIELDKILESNDPKKKANIFRPVIQLSPTTIPLIKAGSTPWGEAYPIVAAKFGRGFLIHTGMSLNNEREYKVLLEVITQIATKSYESFAKL